MDYDYCWVDSCTKYKKKVIGTIIGTPRDETNPIWLLWQHSIKENKMTTFEKYKDLFAGDVNPNIKKVFAILCDEIDSLKDRVDEFMQSMEEGSDLEEEAMLKDISKIMECNKEEAAEFVGPSSKCNLGEVADIEFRKELPPDNLIIAHEKNGGRWECSLPDTRLGLRILNGVLGLTWETRWYELGNLREIWKIHSYRPVDSNNKPIDWNSLIERKIESRVGLPDPEIVEYIHRIGGYWRDEFNTNWLLKMDGKEYLVDYKDEDQYRDNWTNIGNRKNATGWVEQKLTPMKNWNPVPWPDFSFKKNPSEELIKKHNGLWEINVGYGADFYRKLKIINGVRKIAFSDRDVFTDQTGPSLEWKYRPVTDHKELIDWNSLIMP